MLGGSTPVPPSPRGLHAHESRGQRAGGDGDTWYAHTMGGSGAERGGVDGAPAAHQRSTAPTLHTARHCALLTKQLECMSLTTHHTPNIARRKPPHTTSRTTHHVPQAHPPRTAHLTSHAEHCKPHTTACHRTPHNNIHRTPHTTHYTLHTTRHTPHTTPTPCTAHRKPQQTTALHAPHTTHHRTPHTTHQRTLHTAFPHAEQYTPHTTAHHRPHTAQRKPHNAH